jgi:hypothetical protein
MGCLVLVGGKPQTMKIDAETLQAIAKFLGIERSDQVTAISMAISSRPSAARSRPRGRAQGGSRRSAARSTRRPRKE